MRVLSYLLEILVFFLKGWCLGLVYGLVAALLYVLLMGPLKILGYFFMAVMVVAFVLECDE